MYGQFVLAAALLLTAEGLTTEQARAGQLTSCPTTSTPATSPAGPQAKPDRHKILPGSEAPATAPQPATTTTQGGAEKQLAPLLPTKTTTPKGTVELEDHDGKVCQPFDVWLGTEAGSNFATVNSCYVSPPSVATCSLPSSGGGGPLKIHCVKKGNAKVAAEAVEFYTGRIVTLGFVVHCR